MFKLIKLSLAATAAALALGAPATALARFNLNPGTAPVASAVQSAFPQPPSATSSTQGFQWADAGIGAAGVLILVGLGSSAVLVRRRRPHHRLAS